MLDTSARLLRMLSLLQARPRWGGAELAERLGVTTRTVRRDVDRLRQLGYPVDAEPGVDGGYRLGAGGELPPLLLDDEEAIAVAIALGASTDGAVRGIEEATLAALAKLDRLLPPRLRTQVDALAAATVTLRGYVAEGSGPVDPRILTTLAQASAGEERVVFAYTDREGRPSERRVEPYRLVSTGRRWYLVALDLDRKAWRTFRVDRIAQAAATGHRFRLVDPPDAADLVSAAVSVAPYRYTAKVLVEAPVEVLAARVPATVGVSEGRGPTTSLLTVGADDLDRLAGHLVALAIPFEVLEPAELRERLRALGERLAVDHG